MSSLTIDYRPIKMEIPVWILLKSSARRRLWLTTVFLDNPRWCHNLLLASDDQSTTLSLRSHAKWQTISFTSSFGWRVISPTSSWVTVGQKILSVNFITAQIRTAHMRHEPPSRCWRWRTFIVFECTHGAVAVGRLVALYATRKSHFIEL